MVFSIVYFFLSINNIAALIIAIAAMMPLLAGSKYWSVKDAGVCAGSGVAA